MAPVKPTAIHQAFTTELRKLLLKYEVEHKLTPGEALALSAYTVGQIVAVLPATQWTPQAAMLVVQRNIELGNAHVIDNLMDTKGNA